MTGLGPSLRRLSSGDPKASTGAAGGASDVRPDGSSDAGDSLDGQTSGQHWLLLGGRTICGVASLCRALYRVKHSPSKNTLMSKHT